MAWNYIHLEDMSVMPTPYLQPEDVGALYAGFQPLASHSNVRIGDICQILRRGLLTSGHI